MFNVYFLFNKYLYDFSSQTELDFIYDDCVRQLSFALKQVSSSSKHPCILNSMLLKDWCQTHFRILLTRNRISLVTGMIPIVFAALTICVLNGNIWISSACLSSVWMEFWPTIYLLNVWKVACKLRCSCVGVNNPFKVSSSLGYMLIFSMKAWVRSVQCQSLLLFRYEFYIPDDLSKLAPTQILW